MIGQLDEPDEITHHEMLFRGWLTLSMLRVRTPGGEVPRVLVEHASGSAVLPYDPDRRVVLTVNQMRVAPLYLGHPRLPEAPAGAVDHGDFAACARRELLEEAGLEVDTLEPVGQVWITPSTSTERVHLFLAAYSPRDRVAQGGGLAEEGEDIRVEEIAIADLWARTERGEMTDAKTFMLLQALRIRRPELFVL